MTKSYRSTLIFIFFLANINAKSGKKADSRATSNKLRIVFSYFQTCNELTMKFIHSFLYIGRLALFSYFDDFIDGFLIEFLK